MSNPALAGILIAGMLLTGCSNSLWSKFQDKQCVANCDDPDVSTHKYFEQPVWQTLNMFIGEACCLIAFYLINWFNNRNKDDGKVNDPRGYRYISVSNEPRDSIEGANDQDEGLESEPRVGRRSNDLGQLVQPSHLSKSRDPSNSRPLLAVHGPTPAPLAASIEPDQLLDRPEPGVEHLKGFQKMVFWLPTIFDICGTTLMNSGLLFVPVSVFQMVRGALPLWVGLFSIVFLNRHLSREKWFSLMIITFGVALVGYAGSLQQKEIVESDKDLEASSEGGENVVLGIFLIFFAQLFTASQFVIEEKIMTKYEVPPLEAVGLEGIFGLLTTVVAIPILNYTIGSKPENRGGYFDSSTGLNQILSSSALLGSSLAIAISIAFFNFCGLAVTKTISATVRSIIDTCRSIGIWAFSLLIGWEVFSSLQLLGFTILVLGTFLFNDLIIYPDWFKKFIGSYDDRSSYVSLSVGNSNTDQHQHQRID